MVLLFYRATRCNCTVAGVTTSEGLPAGMKWQKRASQLFKTNKLNQDTLKGLNVGTFGVSVTNEIKYEIQK